MSKKKKKPKRQTARITLRNEDKPTENKSTLRLFGWGSLFIIGLLIIIFGAILVEENILFIPLAYLTITIPFLIVYVLFFFNKSKERKKDIISLIIGICTAFFTFMAFLTAYQIYQISYSANQPHIEVQLTGDDLPWGHFAANYNHTVYDLINLNVSGMMLPISLTIYNKGLVPVHIYNIKFQSECDGNYGLLSIPSNQSTLIKEGEFFKMHTSLQIVGNDTIGDMLPCKVHFEIVYPNLVSPTFGVIKRDITLRKP